MHTLARAPRPARTYVVLLACHVEAANFTEAAYAVLRAAQGFDDIPVTIMEMADKSALALMPTTPLHLEL